MSVRDLLERWPVIRQLRDRDPQGLGSVAASPRTSSLRARTAEAQPGVPALGIQSERHSPLLGGVLELTRL